MPESERQIDQIYLVIMQPNNDKDDLNDNDENNTDDTLKLSMEVHQTKNIKLINK